MYLICSWFKDLYSYYSVGLIVVSIISFVYTKRHIVNERRKLMNIDREEKRKIKEETEQATKLLEKEIADLKSSIEKLEGK